MDKAGRFVTDATWRKLSTLMKAQADFGSQTLKVLKNVSFWVPTAAGDIVQLAVNFGNTAPASTTPTNTVEAGKFRYYYTIDPTKTWVKSAAGSVIEFSGEE